RARRSWRRRAPRPRGRTGRSRALRPAVVELANDAIDPIGMLDRLILLELEVRQGLHLHLVPDDLAEVRTGRAQAGARGGALAVVAERRVEDACPPEVGRHGDVGDRDEPDPWVLQPGDLLGEDLAEFLRHSARTARVGHISPPGSAATARSRSPRPATSARRTAPPRASRGGRDSSRPRRPTRRWWPAATGRGGRPRRPRR